MFKLTLKLISVVLFVPLLSFAQQQTIDSLFNVIKKSKQDTNLVNVYNDLTHELIYSDSKKADSIVGLSINLSSSLGYKKGLAWAKYLHALNKRNNSEYGLSLQLFKESEKLFVELNDSINIGSVEQNKGSIYRNLGDYKKATEHYLNSLKIRENIKDKDGIAASLGGLGLVYDDQGDMDKALHYYGEALKIKTELNDQKGIAALYNNIGQAYETQKKYSEALLYLQKSLRIKEKINNRNGIASTLDNIGSIYLALKKYPEAIKYFERSLAIERDMNNQQGICISIYNIGLVKFQQGKTEEASTKFFAAEKIALKYKLKPQLNEIYKSLVDVYVKELDYVSAFNYQKKVIKLTNEMTGEEIAEKIIEMQQKYEVEKTQKEIELLKKEKDLQDKELKTNKKILYIVSISSFILLLFLSYAVHAFLAKKKINKKLSELNAEIENSNKKLSETNENLSKLNKKITLQRDTIEHQHLQLEEKNKDITNSINYAQRLQTAILPPKEFITHLFGKHFIFFQPKDVLSGDFYWFDALEGRVYFAVIDCTGHGVPGAFLSLVAFNLLKHAIHEHGKEKPADILRQVNKDLFDTLNQQNSSLHVQDGMDISLCCYNIHTNQLDYAGANSSIYLIRKDKNDQHVLYEIKADKESIGKNSAEKQFAFTNQIIDIQVNDKLFLFTDGFTDQFGGDLGKKYKHKQLQELLVNNADKPINNMQSILEKEFTSWKKNNEQVDDVLIVGVEF